MQPTHSAPAHTHEAHAAHEHHEVGFWRKYIFSTDHKMIGLQYGITALFFLLFGYLLMALMRWQLAYPMQPVPVVGPLLLKLLGPEQALNGTMTPDLYNVFGAMHGTI